HSVDVFKGVNTAQFGSRGANGAIAIYTRRGSLSYGGPAAGIARYQLQGYSIAREFYSPKYDVPLEEHNLPDIRNTLYWNPSVTTDKQGRAQVTFFTSDVVSEYRVVVQGISTDGIPGWNEFHFEVH